MDAVGGGGRIACFGRNSGCEGKETRYKGAGMWRKVRGILVGEGWEINGSGGGGNHRGVREGGPGGGGWGCGAGAKGSPSERGRSAAGVGVRDQEEGGAGESWGGRGQRPGLRRGPRRRRGTYPDVRGGSGQSRRRLLSS